MFPKVVGFPPKSSILKKGFPLIINHPFLGVLPLFLETPILFQLGFVGSTKTTKTRIVGFGSNSIGRTDPSGASDGFLPLATQLCVFWPCVVGLGPQCPAGMDELGSFRKPSENVGRPQKTVGLNVFWGYICLKGMKYYYPGFLGWDFQHKPWKFHKDPVMKQAGFQF